jgi:hypothetical protein
MAELMGMVFSRISTIFTVVSCGSGWVCGVEMIGGGAAFCPMPFI